jgi:hypothetical protein
LPMQHLPERTRRQREALRVRLLPLRQSKPSFCSYGRCGRRGPGFRCFEKVQMASLWPRIQ